MRALVCEAPGKASLLTRPDPVPGPGEVVVRVKAALTCGTDLKLLRRGHPKVPFPVTLGHEMAGVVEAAGAGAALAPGDRVTSAVTAPCRACSPCRAGRENLCETAFDAPLWGAFADRVLLSPRLVKGAVRRIPSGLSYEAAALLDPLASAVHGLSRVPPAAGARVLIAGCGPIGLLFLLLLKKNAPEIFVTGREAPRLALISSLGGRTGEIEGRFDLVVETTGDPAYASSLADRVASGGTLLLFAGMAAGSRVDVDAFRVHYEEVTVVGSFHYTPADADKALALLASGEVPAAPVLSRSRPLAEWREAFDEAERGDVMKTVLIP
jgi:L-iditol 2-dehydrogenase